MKPRKLQRKFLNFRRRPAFTVYPSGKDRLPPKIRKIRDKWVQQGVDIGKIWQIIRMGYNIDEVKYVIDPRHPFQLTSRQVAIDDYSWKFLFKLSPHMKGLVKKIRNDKRTKDQKESDRRLLIAHCGKDAVDAFEGFFCEQVIRKGPPLSHTVVDVREKGSGKHSDVVGEASYFITELLKKAGLSWSVKIPKEKRFNWKEIFELLSYYYLLADKLKPENIKSFYHYHRKNGVSAYWPTPAKMGISPKSPSKR